MEYQHLKLFTIGIATLALFQLTGCEYSRVGAYSTRDNSIKIEILDPNECDFARYLEMHISAFGIVHKPVLFEVLECGIQFKRSEFEIFEHPDGKWAFFMQSELEQADKETLDNSIWLIFDRESEKLFSQEEKFPQLALDTLKLAKKIEGSAKESEETNSEETSLPAAKNETDTSKTDFKTSE